MSALKTEEDLLPCPFCGEIPEISIEGTQLDIDCCVNMSIQKCDHLSRKERDTFSEESYHYSDEAEAKVLDIAVSKWNKRKIKK